MPHATRQPNLFENLHQGPTDGFKPSLDEASMPGVVRPRLQALLDEARTATRMPWDARAERVNAILFHNMANWLPASERDELRAAFLTELTRLRGEA